MTAQRLRYDMNTKFIHTNSDRILVYNTCLASTITTTNYLIVYIMQGMANQRGPVLSAYKHIHQNLEKMTMSLS